MYQFIRNSLVLSLIVAAMTIATLASESGRSVRKQVAPIYPPIAKQANITGAVRLEVIVSPAGAVKSTKVLGGHPVLAQAATDAVKRWVFEPAGEETTTTVVVKFDAQ